MKVKIITATGTTTGTLQGNDLIPDKKTTVYSSNGEIDITETGEVIEIRDTSDDKCISHISKFDIAEYKRFYGLETLHQDGIDILDIGYWYNDKDGVTQYEKPEEDYRQIIHNDFSKLKGIPLPTDIIEKTGLLTARQEADYDKYIQSQQDLLSEQEQSNISEQEYLDAVSSGAIEPEQPFIEWVVVEEFMNLARLLLDHMGEGEYTLVEDFKMPEEVIIKTAISLQKAFANGDLERGNTGELYYSGMTEDFGGLYEAEFEKHEGNEPTPGEWKVSRHDDNNDVVIREMEDRSIIANLSFDKWETMSDKQVLTNAKIMAASKDLLAACQIALGYRKQTHHGTDECIAVLEAAIKKATE